MPFAYSSPNVTRVIKSSEMQQVGRSEIIATKFVSTSEGNRLLSIFWNKWENNMISELERIGCDGVSCLKIKFTEGVV
jgi:hypothetical protein